MRADLDRSESGAPERPDGGHKVLELPRSQSGEASSRELVENEEPSAEEDGVRSRAPTPQEPPPRRRRNVEVPPRRKHRARDEPGRRHPENGSGNPSRFGRLRRHPSDLRSVCSSSSRRRRPATSIWDHSRHFESTDDAFIAARQFAIAPKVSGYITAVPSPTTSMSTRAT